MNGNDCSWYMLYMLASEAIMTDFSQQTRQFHNSILQWLHNECDGVSNHRVCFICSSVCSCADQRKHQSSASLAFVGGIHRWPVNSPHKGPVTRKMFPFDDVIMFVRLRRIGTRSTCGMRQTYCNNRRPHVNQGTWRCIDDIDKLVTVSEPILIRFSITYRLFISR